MTTKRKRGLGRKLKIDADRPHQGPGQVFVSELIGADSGHARHYRNVGASPLMLAYHRGALAGPEEGKSAPLPGQITAQERFDHGQKFENWHETLHASPSRDSTIQSISGGAPRTLTEEQEYAGRQIAWLRGKMTAKNFLIIVAFCGQGYSMLDSLRQAGVEAHPAGTAYRVREALDELVCVLTGRLQVPILVPPAEKRA
jgi:hypothetical protein